jgi:DNA processing protein
MVACDECLRRTWLLERMGGHLDFRLSSMIDVLELDDRSLIELTTGALRRRLEQGYARFGGDTVREMTTRATASGVEMLCRCAGLYPAQLRAVRAAPAVLHVAGGLERFLELSADDPVALVGSRGATPYGLDAARMLGRGVCASGLTVVSGMAPGVDGAAHEGALAAGGRTIAVIAGCASESYPRSQRGLHRRILAAGAVVSETGPGTPVRRWMLPARNRIIAALSRIVILVQGAERSGAGLTVLAAREYGRPVGAVPGSVMLDQSTASNALLAQGAGVIRDAQDVLDLVFGAGLRDAPAARGVTVELDQSQREVVDAIRAGADTAGALARRGYGGEHGLAMLARLELMGVISRRAGGRYVICG